LRFTELVILTNFALYPSNYLPNFAPSQARKIGKLRAFSNLSNFALSQTIILADFAPSQDNEFNKVFLSPFNSPNPRTRLISKFYSQA